MESRSNPIKFFSLTFSQLSRELKRRYGKGNFHASVIFKEIYKKGNINFGRSPDFLSSKKFFLQLSTEMSIDLAPVKEIKKEAGVIKFVSQLKDGLEIESVIVPMATHCTLCVSSQVGCKMGCKFCETARLGFLRNLSVEEIIGQIYTARFILGSHVRNVVFMGMGEPLDNYDQVVQAIRVMEDQRGLDISKRYISVSTSGFVEGIQKLAGLNWPQLNLAVSLNAPNDQIRSQIMPINKKYPMDTLREAFLKFPMKKNGAVYIEYVLIRHLNDQPEHACQLAEYLKPVQAKVNLIPYNCQTGSLFETPSDEDMNRFLNRLVEKNVFVRKRSGKGLNILAGCGQLGNRLYKNQSMGFDHCDRVI